MLQAVRALALLAALFFSIQAEAAPRRARLTVEVNVEGTESVIGNGDDQSRGTFREGYRLVTYLETDGERQQFNTKDPAYAQKMMGMSNNVQAQVNKAQGKAPARKMTQQEIQQHLQKKQAACGADQGCMMSLAMEAQELMANMDMGGAAASAGGSQSYTGNEPLRYLNYFGFDNCGATSHVYVDRTSNGTYGDVNGPVPYTVVDKADYRANPIELGIYCTTHSLVLDPQDGTFWTDGYVRPEGKGNRVRTVRGRTEQATGEAATHGEVYDWVAGQLRHAPRAGTKKTTMKLTQQAGAALHTGRYSGEATVQLTWRLEDV